MVCSRCVLAKAGGFVVALAAFATVGCGGAATGTPSRASGTDAGTDSARALDASGPDGATEGSPANSDAAGDAVASLVEAGSSDAAAHDESQGDVLDATLADVTSSDDAGASDADIVGDGPFFPDAPCPVEIDNPPITPALHVPIGTSIQWNSNPPSSGQHYPIWAAYQTYTSPVPRGYYVHDLEHGAVVLLYHCGDAGCPEIVAALQAASDALPDDPACAAAAEGVRVRTVVTPDPLLDVPVAAAAWGWTYRAQCADLPSLTQFVMQHYGHGPESFCTNGTTFF